MMAPATSHKTRLCNPLVVDMRQAVRERSVADPCGRVNGALGLGRADSAKHTAYGHPRLCEEAARRRRNIRFRISNFCISRNGELRALQVGDSACLCESPVVSQPSRSNPHATQEAWRAHTSRQPPRLRTAIRQCRASVMLPRPLIMTFARKYPHSSVGQAQRVLIAQCSNASSGSPYRRRSHQRP